MTSTWRWPYCGRHRVIVGAVANQRDGADARGGLIAGLEASRRQRQQRGAVALEAFADGLLVAAQPLRAARHGVANELLVERLPACRTRNRHHEVAPRVADQVLHLPLVVALGRSAELLGEQVVALQLGEGPRLLPLPIAKDPGHGQRGVVVENPRRHAAEVLEGADMSFEKGLRRLGRKGLHKAVVRVRQVEGHEVRLLLHAGDHHHGLRRSRPAPRPARGSAG